MHFTELIDLAAQRLGGVVLAANDEFFAPKENLLKSGKPVFIADRYTERGKWMDGWETRRRRSPGHDWCIIRLGLAGVVRGVEVDTTHFKGNYPEHCSLEACSLDGCPDAEQVASAPYIGILSKSELKGDYKNLFPVDSPQRFTHLRFNIYPDGGVARLRIYGEIVPDWKQLDKDTEFDLAAMENGGLVVASSDMFFGSRQNLILPGPASNMSDGWETRRRRGPGHDWALIRLAASGLVRRVEVDTSHFKGNCPESCSIEACDADGHAKGEILPRISLHPHTRHIFKKEIREMSPVARVRFNIFPDGGVSRLRVIGLCRLRTLSWDELLECCGSPRWASRISARQPFEDLPELLQTADTAWCELSNQDWLEAFGRHPKIGEIAFGPWSEKEQAGTRAAPREILVALAEANRTYKAKFGYIFIVCATGKSAQEMLAMLEQRLANDPQTEIRIAAEEQKRITRLRLEKLLAS